MYNEILPIIDEIEKRMGDIYDLLNKLDSVARASNPISKKNLDTKLIDMEWSVRTKNGIGLLLDKEYMKNDWMKDIFENHLRNRDVKEIVFIGDLVKISENRLIKIPGFGVKSLNEVKNTLSDMSLELSMSIPYWKRPENAN